MTSLIQRAPQGVKSFCGHPKQENGPEPKRLPVDEACEEETLDDYRADRFYPARYHEVLGSRYEILLKLGYGGFSTVWLAKDSRTKHFVTIKILTKD